MPSDPTSAINSCFDALYEDLRRAAYRLKAADGSVTLNPTALVHEAYLRLANSAEFAPESRDHLKYTAIRAMRRLLIDASRQRQSAKRGGGRRPASVEDQDVSIPGQAASLEEMIEINAALERLEKEDPEQAQLLEEALFWGGSPKEMAERAGVSESTIRSKLRLAKAWLKKELGGGRKA